MAGCNFGEIFHLLLISGHELIEGIKAFHRPQIQPVGAAAHRIDAFMEGHLQGLCQIDDIIGRTDAAVPQHVFSAAKEAVLPRFLGGNVHGVFHRADGGLVVEQQRVGHSIRQHFKGEMNDLLVHALVHAQGEFRLELAEPEPRLHDRQGHPIRVFRIPPSQASHHDAAIPAVRILHQAVKGQQKADGFFLR